MNLDAEETQILCDILYAVKQGFLLELNGQRPGVPIPNEIRGAYIKKGVALCDKIMQHSQFPEIVTPGQGGFIPPQ